MHVQCNCSRGIFLTAFHLCMCVPTGRSRPHSRCDGDPCSALPQGGEVAALRQLRKLRFYDKMPASVPHMDCRPSCTDMSAQRARNISPDLKPSLLTFHAVNRRRRGYGAAPS